MARERTHDSSGLLIEANFRPGREPRFLKFVTQFFCTVLVLCAVGAMVVYSINIHYEKNINEIGHKTRSLTEMNKELQVQLNKLQSYKNVEVAAEKLPQLHLSEEVIEVVGVQPVRLPDMPKRQGVFRRVEGY